MSSVALQALAANPYRPRGPRQVAGMYDFMPDLILADGSLIGEEIAECRCRYLVRLASPHDVVSSASTEPPQGDEVLEIGDFEMKVRRKNPDWHRGEDKPRFLTEWQPIPADFMPLVNRWVEVGGAFYDGLFDEARERADEH